MSALSLFAEQPSSDPISVAALIAAYTKSLDRRKKTGGLSEEHVENCKRNLRNFQKFVGYDRLIRNCRQYDLTEWLLANPSWKSLHTKKQAVGAVLVCFAWGADDEEGQMIDRNPYRLPKSLKGVMPPPRRPALESEYLALIREGSRPLRWALFFMWWTGARTCEMREVTWCEVHFGAEPHIRLERHKTWKKTGRPRIIALNPVAAKFLLWLRGHSVGDQVFQNCDGGKWDRHTFARHLRRTARRIGLDDDSTVRNVSGYCLRHSFACAAVETGSTFEQVADQLGNSAEVVRKIYASSTREHLGYMSRVANEIADRRGN